MIIRTAILEGSIPAADRAQSGRARRAGCRTGRRWCKGVSEAGRR